MANTSNSTCELPSIDGSVLLDGFCAFQLDVKVNQARSIVSLPGHRTDFLVLERGLSSISLCQNVGTEDHEFNCRMLVQKLGLNHGLELSSEFLYASTSSEVVRWPIDMDLMLGGDPNSNPVLGGEVLVVNNINEDGRGGAPFGHTTRTLVLDESKMHLYISVGSAGNVDRDSFRSRIRRFDISREPDFPLDFLTGEVFADGLRNEVGLAFDKHAVLWGVENGADRLQRQDLGGDIHNDNPGEELNRLLENETRHYGYPYCWSEFLLDPSVGGKGAGSQWAWPQNFDVVYTDEDCQNEALFVRPALSMQAHSAPLGIEFYRFNADPPSGCDGEGAFPQSMDGYAFIAFHGSWNRQTPTGYKIVYVPMDSQGFVDGTAQDLLAHQPPNARWQNGFRPVDVTFDACGRLLVTSDGTGSTFRGAMVVRIDYHGNGTFLQRAGTSSGPAWDGGTGLSMIGLSMAFTFVFLLL